MPTVEQAFDRRSHEWFAVRVRERPLMNSSLTAWADPCFDRQERRASDREKEPAETLICVWLFSRRRSTPDRLLESFGISRNAAAIPARTDLMCTRTAPANLLRTPSRGQSCRVFACCIQAISITEHFRDGILLVLIFQ